MTTNFYAPPSSIQSDRVVLPESEARHARTVLRAREGDEIVVVDGEGGWYRVQLDHLSSDQAVGSIIERRRDVGEPEVDVTVGIGILKKRSRLETFVEKAVELGVRRITPLRARRTERNDVRGDRLEKVMLAALKQCRRSRLPTLTDPKSLENVLDDGNAEMRFICHGTGDAVRLPRAVKTSAPDASVLLLVGPEGGFAPAEVEYAKGTGCTPVSLGTRRLRAETAGLAALHTVTSIKAARE